MEEELVAVLVSPDEYAHHIGQVSSVGSESLKVVRRKFSISTPYAIQSVPLSSVASAEYRSGLVPFRIGAGVLLLSLLLGIAYYLGVYWESLPPNTSVRVGLLGLAALYGLKWAFMSRRHEFVFRLHDRSKISWRSRSGNFKYKRRAVEHVLDFLRKRGFSIGQAQ
jgi:hypothetical protein